MKVVLICLIIVFAFSLLVLTPLFKEGLYSMHDDQQVARLFLYDQALKTGQLPPRWVDKLGFGFGYPLFIFYPPLVYIIGEMFHLIGFGYIDSIKIVFFLSISLSGISMYALSRYLFGNFAGVIGSIFYILVPYRALDAYVRGALAESFSFVWLPLIILYFLKMHKQPNTRYSLICGVFLSLLMITHNLIFLPFLLISCLLLVYLLVSSKKRAQFALSVLMAFLTSAMLTAFFWMPAILEKKFTIVDELLLVNLASYKIHFVYPVQLWNWTWGFGGSSQGIMDGISYKIGKLHIVVSVLAFIVSLLFQVSVKDSRIEQNNKLIPLFFALLIFSAFMTTSYSSFLWDLIKPIGYLQFPWRFLAFTALFSSILAAALIYSLRLSFLKLFFGSTLILLLVFYNVKLFKPQYMRLDLTDEKVTSDENLTWNVSQSSFEYIPKGVEIIVGDKGTNLVNISKGDIPKNKIVIDEGRAKIQMIAEKPDYLEFNALVEEQAFFTANIYDFPVWKLTVNGIENNYNSNNKFRLIKFDLPRGEYNVKLEFQNTQIRLSANLISAISFLLLISYFITNKQFVYIWQTHKKK